MLHAQQKVSALKEAWQENPGNPHAIATASSWMTGTYPTGTTTTRIAMGALGSEGECRAPPPPPPVRRSHTSASHSRSYQGVKCTQPHP
ncbi:Hypp2534 [Branchiostoma lanceolatum]|uniref:Hypp2534 protein n=1 Tax=Branchiostoma lanceolatum TaxID=7740 RepID=A0A8K0EQA2_BRALA|nr:Hypp2534 [Branchiostoma lanceolatum]